MLIPHPNEPSISTRTTYSVEATYNAIGVHAGGASDRTQRELDTVASSLVARSADCILLAYTELPLAAPEADACWKIPAIDPSLVVARE